MTARPLPIAPCPNPECKSPIKLRVYRTGDISFPGDDRHQVVHDYCGYRGPSADTEAEAIRLHNLIAAAVPASAIEALEAKLRESSAAMLKAGDTYGSGLQEGLADALRALIAASDKPVRSGR